ncbi:SCAN domain-containing protein 3 [Oopsacas minuta]|uniref:SCAN domain-containing protein 3 n=1 Tax=Oopsacas minuta TaxID=111878 RepID=A0AAV7JW17_9METZ|nr:SCAN domain-containing protein 3 [Oopsacas minuta]
MSYDTKQRYGITHEPASGIDIFPAAPLHSYLTILDWFLNLIYRVAAGRSKSPEDQMVRDCRGLVCIVQKLAGAEDNVKLLQIKNSKIIDFAKPLAQKLQQTQEELETFKLRNQELRSELNIAERSNIQFSQNHSNLEEQFSSLTVEKDILDKKCDELINSQTYLEQKIEKESGEKAAFLSKLKDYEEDIKSLNQQLLENSQLLETIKRDDAIKKKKILQMSHTEESLLQSKLIISNLENKIENLMKTINTLQNVISNTQNIDEVSLLNMLLLEAESKFSEKASLCHKLKEQNILLQTEVNNKDGLKSEIYPLKNDIEIINDAETLDKASQTKITQYTSSNIHQISIRGDEVSNLQHKITSLESERDCLLCETEDMQYLKTKLLEVEQQNIELNIQIQGITFLRSFIDELEILTIKSDQMSTQLKIVQTLSQDSENVQVCKQADVFQSEFLDLIDQLRAFKDLLTNSLANEKRLELLMHTLKENLKEVQIEKSNIFSQLCEADVTISGLKKELDIIKSSFQTTPQYGDQHLNKLDSLLILNPSTSSKYLQENLISKNNPDSLTLLPNEDLTKKSKITRCSSTPCIRTELSSDNLTEDMLHVHVSTCPKAANIHPESDSQDISGPDEDELIDKSDKPDKRGCMKIRNYDIKFIRFGFTSMFKDGLQKPQCVVCGEVWSNEALKLSKLSKHSQTKHKDLISKPVEFFKRKRDELTGCQKQMYASSHINVSALRASYKVSLRCKGKKPYIIGEKLLVGCIGDVCQEMLGESAAKRTARVPLSNDAVARRVIDLACDMEEQLIEQIKSAKWYSLQLDESIEVANLAILLLYVRFEHYGDVKEEYLCSISLPTNATSSQIFDGLNNYIVDQSGLYWQFCVGVCTDGAAAITGRHSGVVAKIKEVAPDCESTHCFIHRENLATKKMPKELNDVLCQVVKVVNHVKANALNSRLFASLCDQMGAGHIELLLHAEVCWLSRGKVLSRVFELRNELTTFLLDKKPEWAENFEI